MKWKQLIPFYCATFIGKNLVPTKSFFPLREATLDIRAHLTGKETVFCNDCQCHKLKRLPNLEVAAIQLVHLHVLLPILRREATFGTLFASLDKTYLPQRVLKERITPRGTNFACLKLNSIKPNSEKLLLDYYHLTHFTCWYVDNNYV